MGYLALYWSFMIIGYVIAHRLALKGIHPGWIQNAMMFSVYVLCLIMGLRMGINEQVTSNLGSIGIMALIVTLFCVAGSMGAVYLVRRAYGMNRYGDRAGEQESQSTDGSNENSRLNIKSTIIILLVVACGMVIGALIIAKRFSGTLAEFESVSAICLVVLLCILLFFVGFDLGASGDMLTRLKKAGFKVVVFPFAAVLGTLIAGTLTCIIMGFSLKEGLAICLGFGWYTYAPVVIAEAGKQYMIASAVSFMHNVIRETAGIIFIPVLAKKIGYLESTAIPGVAAMDVCMPIIERACKADTLIYSFATGLLMCIVTSSCVPLVMGL